LVNQDVSAVWAEGDLNSISKGVTTLKHFVSGLVSEEQLLGCEVVPDLLCEEGRDF
jgi:hypothetical protein